MSKNISPFRIEILDVNNNKIGGGPITTAIDLNDERKLDGMGTLDFSMPANDTKAGFIKTGVKFDVYDEIDGYLGRYIFSEKKIRDRNGIATLQVKCFDALRELQYATVGFYRNFNYVTVDAILNNLAAVVSGWTVENTDDSISTISYSGESVFRAIDELRDRTGSHFRLKHGTSPGNNVIEFGSFGDISDLTFEQFNGQVMPDWNITSKNVIVTEVEETEVSDEIWNKIIPLGFGQGVSQLTIKDATLGNFNVESENNADGSLRYFISDTSSIAEYGQREKILQFPNIRPISNSTLNIINAANALKLTAEAYAQRHLEPQFFYRVDILGLRENINPGDKVHIKYVGENDGFQYLTLNDDFWVMNIKRNRSASGNRYQSISISNVDNNRTSDQDVIVDVVRDLRDISVHIPATLAYSPIGPYSKRILGNASTSNRIDANFVARIKEEVLYINRALLRIKTDSLKSSTTAAAAGGDHYHAMFQGGAAAGTGTRYNYASNSSLGNPVAFVIEILSGPNDAVINTFGASGDHTHDITYGVFKDSQYPRTISIEINGVNRDSELGGPFAVSESQVDLELDVTDILVDDGIRRNHTFVFTAESGRGEIEFELDLLCTIQPIAVS